MTSEAVTLTRAVEDRERLLRENTILRAACQYVDDEIRLWEPSAARDNRLLSVCRTALDETGPER